MTQLLTLFYIIRSALLFHIQLYIELYTVPDGLFDLAHMEEFTSEECVQLLMGIIAGISNIPNPTEVGVVFLYVCV